MITWTPGEAQGPGSYVVTVLVIDNNPDAVNAKQLVDTKTFTLTVNDVNSAPTLPVIAAQTINELATLTITNTATDTDIPANTLTYQLLAGPTNATISASGIITWTPTEAQGPGTNVFTTKVTDDGTPLRSSANFAD